MDGTHAINDIEDGSVVQRFKDHKKYVLRHLLVRDFKTVPKVSYKGYLVSLWQDVCDMLP